MDNAHKDDIQEIARAIKGVRFAMFSTLDDSGGITSRPMTTQELEFDGQAWFFASASSEVCDEIGRDPRVNLAYSDEGKSKYVSLSGTASVVRDEAKSRELFNPMVKAYFPGGPDDPELRLIRVDVAHARIWDAPSSGAVRLFNMAKAVVTGNRDDQGRYEEVDLGSR